MSKANKEKNKITVTKKGAKGKKTVGNKKTFKNKTVALEMKWDFAHSIAFWGLAVLLFLPPYFRGLFFAPEQEKALILAALVFWLAFLWRWLQNDHQFLRTPLDWFAIALPAVYLISSFTAVNKGLAIDEVVKNILYFMTYWSVSRLVRNDEDIHKLMLVIYCSAVGVALAGLAAATGIISINDGFLDGRIYSTFQYPNALAAYLGAVMFIGLYLWDRVGNSITEACSSSCKSLLDKLYRWNFLGCLFAMGNYIALTVLFGTKSRGGLIVFVIVLIVYLIGLGAEKRLFAALHAGFTGLIAYIVISKFIPLALAQQGGKASLWFFGGLVLAVIIQIAFSYTRGYLIKRWQDKGKNYTITFGVMILFAAVAGGVLLLEHAAILQKVTDFSYLRTAFQRVNYIGAATEMIIERPLIGWGGGGWQEAYRYFMDYYYVSRQVHSYYFQVGVETGFLGLLVIAGIWASFLYMLHILYHGSKGNHSLRQLIWTLTAVFLMISGHALIDFDLSLSAYTLVLWTCFGMVAGLAIRRQQSEASPVVRKPNSSNYVPIGVLTSVIVVLMIITCCLIQSGSFMNQGIKMLQSQRGNEGIEYLEKAVIYHPFRADFHLTLAQAYNTIGSMDQAMEEVQKAVNLSKYGIAPRAVLAQVAVALGNYNQAIAAIEDTIRLNPNDIAVYENAAGVYTQIGAMELTAGNREKAREYFQTSLQVSVRMDNYDQNISEANRKLWTGPKLSNTAVLKLYTGQASYWLGDFNTAEKNIQEALKEDKQKSQALVYLALLQEKQGHSQKSQEILLELEKTYPDTIKIYEYFKQFPVL